MKDYKKILEGVVNIINTAEKSDIGFVNICDYIGENCPELAMSEDEKIRKDIINFLQETIDNVGESPNIWTMNNAKKWIDWLEKQNSNANKEYWRGYREGKQEILDKYAELEKQGTPNQVSIWKHWKDGICGNGEGKLIYLIKDGDDYSLSSSLAYECDYIELSVLDELMLPKKQGEQKPDIIIPKFRVGDNIKTTKEAPLTITKIDDEGYWSEDLFICGFDDAVKWEIEQESAWSEEDKSYLNTTIAYLKDAQDFKKTAENCINWLKSLKDRNLWKPSDEQINALSVAVKHGQTDDPDALKKLLEQLKKLTE